MTNQSKSDLEFKYVNIGGHFYGGAGTSTGQPEMCFDVSPKSNKASETVFANLTVDEAKVLRDRLNEFIDWATVGLGKDRVQA